MNSFKTVKKVLLYVSLFLSACLAVLFSVLYVNTFTGGFFYENKIFFIALVTVTVAVITVIALSYVSTENKTVYKITIVILFLMSLFLSILYLLKISGIGEKIDSIEDLRNYVGSFGYLAVLIFIIMNVLQVVILPIPGLIAIGTGVALFGAFKAVIFSLIGILIGSFIAFFIGRVLGYRVVSWMVGKQTLDKWLNSVKNKDKIVLTFMFLFPFFPDDVLCFVAGLSTMSNLYFVIMITACRIISIVISAYSLNGSIIPFDTWWGIVIWVILGIVTVFLTIIFYKNGDKIEKFFKNKFKRRRKDGKSNSSR